MALGVTLIIVGVVVLIIWFLIEFKRFRHKTLAVVLIALVLLSYFGFMASIKGKDINLKTTEGLKTAAKLYFVWLGVVFRNVKSITTNAIKMDWKGDNSTIKSD